MSGMDVYTIIGAGGMLSGHRSPPHISCATCIRFNIHVHCNSCSLWMLSLSVWKEKQACTCMTFIQVNLFPIHVTVS